MSLEIPMAESDAATYMILDVDSGNGVAIFEEWETAASALRDMAEFFPARGESLALVAFDKSGFALETMFPSDFPALSG
jgi:hypothetical protein